MHHKKLVWHIFPAILMVTIGALVLVLLYSSQALEKFYIDWTKSALEDRAFLIEEQVTDLLRTKQNKKLNAFCRHAGRRSSTRITVIAPDGTVLADSDKNPAEMDNHRQRREVVLALQGETGTSLRYSKTLGKTMLYVALPLQPERSRAKESSLYTLRMAVPASFIDDTLKSIRFKVVGIGFMVALLAMAAAIIVSRRITKPLEKMTQGAEQLAQEKSSRSLPTTGTMSAEVAALATAMNSMAVQLQQRIVSITMQHSELKSVLTSMVEGVIVVDEGTKITSINTAACKLLAVDEDTSNGKKIQEVIRNIHFGEMIDQVLTSSDLVEDSIVLSKNGSEVYLQCRGVPLYDGDNACFGAVITMNDVTKIKLLENLRRDFVANVSHELMTPLTSIKGYAETLLDSGQDSLEQSKKFLAIIVRQADRLTALVQDLLQLSRIEKEVEEGELVFVPSAVQNMLDNALQVCSLQAKEKNIAIELICPQSLSVPADPALLEQALVNLLVNAIKYSLPENRIILRAEQCTDPSGEKSASILVRDFGVGIEKHHLPRLFERFYRSDKARSRKLGGTGLGLAIVKHIVQAHSGRVLVQSEVGVGTSFTIILPFSQATGRQKVG